MLYLAIDDPLIQAKSLMSEEALKEEILKSLKMNGLVIKDLNIVKEMDKTLEKGGASSVIPVTLRNPKGDEKEPQFSEKGTSVISYNGFNTLKEHMKNNIVKICEDMLNGIIDIEPCKKGSNSQCAYCSFLSICQFDSSLGFNKYNIPKKLSKKEVLQIVEGDADVKGAERSGE
jgi:ATP-dependent helicase/nuclease subunit B